MNILGALTDQYKKYHRKIGKKCQLKKEYANTNYYMKTKKINIQ